MRAAFFAAVVDMVQHQCLRESTTMDTKKGLCLLSHTSVAHLVVKTTFYSYWTPPEFDLCVEYYQVNANQDKLFCFDSTAHGLQRTPAWKSGTHAHHPVGGMPHFHVSHKNRTAQQQAEAETWFAEFGRTLLQQLWRDFRALDDNVCRK